MNLTLEQAIWQKFVINFAGTMPPEALLESLRRGPVGGVTLFRGANIENPAQVRELTAALQRASSQGGWPPLLIAADQEGGQLMALGEGTTPFPGNLALGAAGSTELARRAGYACGRELAAMGINVNYAPVCDVLLNPDNPAVGTRAFGDDPEQVGRLSAAMVEGLQAAGVAACAKHFLGMGKPYADPHYTLPVCPYDLDHLRRVEMLPFEAAVRAGVRMVMTAHVAIPAVDGGRDLPATLSPAVLRGLLRSELGFEGVIVSDALDMGAIRQGLGLAIEAMAAARASVDLLLFHHNRADLDEVYAAVLHAAQRGILPEEEIRTSTARVLEIKRWLEGFEQPPLDVVGCAEHLDLAREVARRSVTLVRDAAGCLPLRLPQEARLAVILPGPADLTPADTSSYVTHTLAQALRRYHPRVDEILIPIDPSSAEVAARRQQAAEYDLVIAGTISARAHSGQADLVNALLEAGTPTIAVALRAPYDLQAYPAVSTYACTYSILQPAMEALAAALFGQIPFSGRLPVSLSS
jgi:beta-N-acetylhexosaminidase